MIYFDHNASSPLLPEARQAWMEAADLFFANPSSPHRPGARSEAALNSARAQLARTIGCDPLDIVWTSGATESSNLVLHHVAAAADPSAEIWISAIEHPSVLRAARHYFRKRLRLLPVSPSGILDLNFLAEQVRASRPALIAVMAANNETGALQPWRQIQDLCRSREIPFFCDATQWLGRLPSAGIGTCDFVSGSGHKFGAPRGIGFLKCPATGPIAPLLHGGSQEEGRRAGTENLPGAVALATALTHRETALASGSQEERAMLRQQFETRLRQELPATEMLAEKQPRLWNTIAVLMPQTDCQQRWVVKLDKRGFAVSTGSACASGREEPSHVLTAMGYSSAQAARALRFSSGWETSSADWDALFEALLSVGEEFAKG